MFFKNADLSGLELTAAVVSPSDGSVEVSSEKVNQGRMSSIDGYGSGSSGFDFAVAFEGESDSIEVDLRVSKESCGGKENTRFSRYFSAILCL